MNMHDAIRAACQPRNLNTVEMQDVMRIIMDGSATPAQIGAFLAALHIKGETVDELTGAATVMRDYAAKVDVSAEKVVDTVGTGGDAAGLFNVSTAAAFVAAAGGAVMAKHGNRAATGKSGSADVLEAAGVNIALSPGDVARTIEAVGIGFMFAPTHHGATRHAVGPRREIGVRSIFNLLGPLTNPAGARWQLVGVYEERWVRPLAESFGNLGSVHTLVVHAEDGLDEISIAAPTSVSEYKDGSIADFTIKPDDFGLTIQSLDSIRVDSAEQSLELIRQALGGHPGPAYDMVMLNAGATLYAADLAPSLAEGIIAARAILDSSAALGKLDEMAAYTQRFEQS